MALCGVGAQQPVASGTAQSGVATHISEIGIDRSGLSMQSEAVRQKTLSDIHALHATWFRDGPSSGTPAGVANFVEELRLAKEQDLKVLITIMQMDEDYDGPLVMTDHGWRAKPLSQINLTKFSHRFSALLDALKAANIPVDAVEFGSEDDCYYYDADVPSGHTASASELHIWLRGYGEFLKTGAQILHDPRYYPQANIVTFGMAHSGDWPGAMPQSLAKPAKEVAMLADVDSFNYLDNASYHVNFIGTHIYASPSAPAETATALLHEDTWALGRAKPLWVTEFGFLDPTKFPNKTASDESQAVAQVLAAFDNLGQRVPLGPLCFYSYNSGAVDSSNHEHGLVDLKGNFVPVAGVLSARAKKR
jgi:hypothetical protein